MTPRLPTLFFWQTVRNIRRHRTLALLNLCSVALGVAVYLAIQIANQSANRSFAAGVDLVAGKAHLEARGRVPDTVFPAIAAVPGVAAATPLLEGVLTLPDYKGEYLRLLGIDVFSNSQFQTFTMAGFKVERWLSGPGQVAISEGMAQRLGLQQGSKFRVMADSRIHEVTVAFLMTPEKGREGSADRFAVVDLGWAQELIGKQGRLTSVQMLLENPLEPEGVIAAVQKVVPGDVLVETPRQRSLQLEKMVGAFQLNLTALSLVSMLVGMFLIYNTVIASVARHRREIGILRAIGTSQREILFLFLGEAALFGGAGALLGIGGGVVLSQTLIGAVSQTISSLYVLTRIATIAIDPLQVALAGILGIGSVIVAAWTPAGEAARLPPLEALTPRGTIDSSSSRTSSSWVWIGIASLALAAISGEVALRWNIGLLGFVCAFFVIFGFASFARLVTGTVASLAFHLSAQGPVLIRLAAQALSRSLRRNSVTVAALSAAIAMMVAISVMIFSFRGSLEAWLDRSVVADLFIAPASNDAIGLHDSVPPAAPDYLRSLPGVTVVNTFHELPVQVAGEGRAVLSIMGADRATRSPLPFINGHAEEKMARLYQDGGVAVTESFSRKFGKGEGEPLVLLTPGGPKTFKIAGVYRDYTRDAGVIQINREEFDRHWDDPMVNSLAVYLKKGADAAAIGDQFRERFAETGVYTIYRNADLRKTIINIFDQTFAVTSVLRVIAVMVAAVGVFLSVTTAVMEREREIGIFRAMGASARQIRGIFLAEAGLIGVAASLLGVACGVVLAAVLTGVLNRIFFGWSIDLHYPWGLLAATPLWIIPVALISAWVPGWRAAQQSVAAAVRSE